MKEELRTIPKKNYIILLIVILVTLGLLYYFYLWFDAYHENKISKPILNKYMEVINYNELDNYIVENPNSVVYVSVLEDEEIRKFEKQVKASFKNNKVNVDILYLDITDSIKDSKIKNEMQVKYGLNSLSMVDVPCVMYIENGVLVSIFSVVDNNYDVNKFITFVNSTKENRNITGNILGDSSIK